MIKNENFFAKWSPQMAYVLGYFCADGCMFVNPRGSKYVSFYSTDDELISKVKNVLKATNKITVLKRSNSVWKNLFSLQIGSQAMYSDLLKIGLAPKKAKRLSLPEVPDKYLRHFVRGYFDGDGSISSGYYKRKARSNKNTFYCLLRFASGSKAFLKDLSERLSSVLKLEGGSLIKNTGGFHLAYSKNNTLKLFNFMYNNLPSQLFLTRKYRKFQKAFESVGAVA